MEKVYTTKKWRSESIGGFVLLTLFWILDIGVCVHQYFTHYASYLLHAEPFLDWVIASLQLTILSVLCSVFLLVLLWIRRYAWSHTVISDDTMYSVVFFRRSCSVNRKQTIYYSIAKVCVDRCSAPEDTWLFVSNDPFELKLNVHATTQAAVFDPRKQIALPHNHKMVRLLGDGAVFLGEKDFSAERIKQIRRESRRARKQK